MTILELAESFKMMNRTGLTRPISTVTLLDGLFPGKYISYDGDGFILIKPSESKVSLSVESYHEKTAENDQYCYVAEKCIVFNLSKISIPNFYSTN